MNIDPIDYVTKQQDVLKKALIDLPTSINLWKLAIELESDITNAKTLLSCAVEFIHDNLELWLAYSKLETDVIKKKQILSNSYQVIYLMNHYYM